VHVISLKDIPDEVVELIERKSAETGLSSDEAVIHLLRERVALERDRQQEHHDLDHLAGQWTEREALEFERGLAEDRTIDPDIWS
jgi:hypothetical protein